METRSHRAWKDAMAWRYSRREVVFPLLTGALAFCGQAVILGGFSWSALGISIAVVVLAAVVIPAGVFGASWVTAVGRINREQIEALRGEIEDFKKTLPLRHESRRLLVRLKELRAVADMLSKRLPPLAPPPDELDQAMDDWAIGVSAELSGLPEMRAQFDAAMPPNPLMAAFRASAASTRFQARTNILDVIIRHLATLEAPP
ncbi:MAG: hypothetical protein WA724_03635 [Candidatus Dormiibacterota bacterium]